MKKRVMIFFIIFSMPFYLYSEQISLKIFDDSRISFSLLSAAQVNLNSMFVNNTKVFPDRIILKNTGKVPVSFALAVKVTSSGLTPVKTVPGKNQFRLFGLFHQWNITPAAGKYGEDDIISTCYGYASTNVYASLDDLAEVKGTDVAEQREVSCFLRIDTPNQITVNPVTLKMNLLIKAFIVEIQEEPHKKPDKKIFTPNGDGVNDNLVFHGLSEKLRDQSFNISIFSLKGHLVRAIKGVEFWDGKDDDGRMVASGTYIFQYEYNNEYITGVIIVAR